MTCNNCVHGDLCVWIDKEILYNLKGRTLEKIKADLQPKCKQFKNKADVVEVVRCQHCVYCVDLGMSGLYCDHDDNRNPLGCRPNDYCNDGERRASNEQ